MRLRQCVLTFSLAFSHPLLLFATDPSAATNDPPAPAASTLRPGGPESWPDFRNGPQLTGVANTTLPDSPELLWEVSTPDGVSSTPAIADGRVYIGTISGDVLCLDLKTGREVWKYRSIESADPDEFAPGFTAPVAVSTDAVFIGDDDGMFHAIERETGRKRWTFKTDGEIVGGATVLADAVLFGSHDGFLYLLNAADGEVVWKFEALGPINAAQSISGQYTFVTGCDKPILRVVDIKTGTQFAEAAIDSLLIASPAVVDGVLYFGTDGGSVVALDWRQQKTLWTYADPKRQQQIHSSPAILGDRLVIGSRDKRLHGIHRLTGERLWTFTTRGRIDGSPVIVGDRVFFGSADKNLYAVRLSDGTEVWKHAAGQSFTGSPAVGEEHLVIGADESNGRILCFGAK